MAHIESAIIERRLRPIYDLLEAGNNKKALQETEKVLKKIPDLQCARALKALALLRMGREEESQVAIDSLVNEKPHAESTLQVMSFWFREQEQLDKICLIYANAVKQLPGNEEILTHLFMSCVRIYDFQAQHAVALQLYKLTSKPFYYLWAVVSILLKVLRGPEGKMPQQMKILLALAQRMMDKLMETDKLASEQDVQLYINILELQNKYQDSLDYIDSPIAKRLYPGLPISYKIKYLKIMNKWAELNILLKSLLTLERDRWDYYKEYIQSVVELKKIDNETEGADYRFDLCYEFLCQLIETTKKKIRGPYLGRLELHRVMRENGFNSNELIGDFLQLLVEYFRLFGDKPCCTNDIVLFLKYVEPYRRAELATLFLRVCNVTSTSLPQNKEQMQQHICSLQISRICGAHSLSVLHLAALYTAFSLHYEHGVNAFSVALLPNDLGPSDAYALLAAHVMYDLALKLNSSERLIEALCLLNYLLTRSPSNFHAKLLCLQIEHVIGDGWGAHKTYESLDVKHVQLDSLGYLHCAQLPIAGIPSITKSLYDQTLKFFTSSYNDGVEFIILGYKFGSYSKLEEFMEFRERLANSFHYSLIATEALLLEMMCFSGTYQQNMMALKLMSIVSHEDRIQWDALQDNRDLSILIRWDPPLQLQKQLKQNDELTMVELTSTLSNNNLNTNINNCDSNTIENDINENENENNMNCDDNQQQSPSSSQLSFDTSQQLTSETTSSAYNNSEDEQDIDKESFQQDIELLKIRSTLLRLTSACIEAINSSSSNEDGGAGGTITIKTKTAAKLSKTTTTTAAAVTADTAILTKYDILRLLTHNWKDLFLRLRKMNYKKTSNEFLVNILPSRLHGILEIPLYEYFFINIQRLILALHAIDNDGKIGTADATITSDDLVNDDDECPELLCQTVIDNFKEITNLLCVSIDEYNENLRTTLWGRRMTQERVTLCIEMLSLATFIISVCNEKYACDGNRTKKGKRKEKADNKNHQQQQQKNSKSTQKQHQQQENRSGEKNSTTSKLSCAQIVESLVIEFKTNLHSCDKALDKWLPPGLATNLNECLASMTLNTKADNVVITLIKDGHIIIKKELKNIIKDKIRLLK